MPKGRKPKPTRLKLMDGTRKDRVNAAEPTAPPGLPAPPAHLDRKGKTLWRKYAAWLVQIGAGQTDAVALERLCSVYARVRDCERTIKREGLTYTEETTQSGTIVRARPEVAMLNAAERELRALLVEFGLTPSSRARLKAPTATTDDDELEAFMAGGRKKA